MNMHLNKLILFIKKAIKNYLLILYDKKLIKMIIKETEKVKVKQIQHLYCINK